MEALRPSAKQPRDFASLRNLVFLVGLVACAGLALWLIGCTRATDPWEGVPGEPRVVVTIAPLYSFVKAVGGERPAVICLCKDRGPHHFQYDVREAVLLQKADCFFAVGLTLDDHFADKMAQGSQRPELRYVRLGNSLGNLRIKLANPIRHGDHVHTGYDPHAWLGIDEAIVMVKVIRDKLAEVDKRHTADYDKNAADYIAQLEKLKADGRALIAKGKHRRIFSHHDSLRYFARCFGTQIVDVIDRDPGAEPTGRHLATLVKEWEDSKEEGKPITAIAVEPQYPKNTSAKALQDEIKNRGGTIALIEIDPLETANAADLERLGAKWYETKMRQNLEALAKGKP